ncbi:MAG TPA: hypothetical protein VJ891_11260 [Casimicrobiaceae bacterium]|nr:hypothetical protein [Casimicrobiaceae bacterium]
MADDRKSAPCAICGKALPLPPWRIVPGSLECLEHSVQKDDGEMRDMIDLVQTLNEAERRRKH